MHPDLITIENFAAVLLDESSRNQLLAAMKAESGGHLPFRNHVSDVAGAFQVDSDELDRIVSNELSIPSEDFLNDIVFHPGMRESTLLRIYDSGLCLTALAHRTGPFALLDRIAKEHRTEEAVLTLLLRYYATDSYADTQFEQFVQDFQDVHSVRYELQYKRNIPQTKLAIGRSVIDT